MGRKQAGLKGDREIVMLQAAFCELHNSDSLL